jgi:Tfp pilus assembly protein PilF
MRATTYLPSIATPEAQVLVEKAHVALQARQTGTASELLQRALRIDPANPMALTKLAEVALAGQDHRQALRHLDAALQHEPHFAPAWTEMAHALWLLGRRVDAVPAARKAMDIQPHNARFRLRFVQFAAWTGQISEARTALAALLDPKATEPNTHATAIGMMGEICVAEGRFDAATPYLEDALGRLPGLPAARVILSLNRLRLGYFDAGWPDFGIREAGSELYPGGPPAGYGPWWEGGDLTGKSLLVADDQGHGDAIQFFRYLPMIRALGPAQITWRTFPPLVRLFADAAPDVTVLAGLPAESRYDTHCTSTSLPRWFGTTATSIPSPGPYLAPPSRLSRLKRPAGARLRVGLVWSGDSRHMRDHLRSIPASVFLQIADVPGIAAHSLQHQVRDYDQSPLRQRPAINRDVEKALSLADTATLIAGLDLVIAVDTAVAHLAAAMGKPVWLLVHSAPDWRWQTERTDNPWYPTIRLFRLKPSEWVDRVPRSETGAPQAPESVEPDDMGWQPLIRRVCRALRDFQKRRRS